MSSIYTQATLKICQKHHTVIHEILACLSIVSINCSVFSRQVAQSDTLAKIALKFDSTPSELTRLNKLASRMIFQGQVCTVHV